MIEGCLRVGVIGTTWYAETHMASISASPGARLAAIAGRDLERAREVAARNGGPLIFSDFRELIASGAVDALVVVAPDELHEDIAVESFRHGLHVLCEKPLARTATEARRMADAAAVAGLVNMSYFGLRNSGHHRYLAELVDRGTIGAVRSASFTLAHGMFRTDQYNWRFDARRGGGVIADLGCYVFDLARRLVGDVRSVVTHGGSYVTRPAADGVRYPPSHDSALGLLTFESGAHATFEVSVLSDIGPGFQRSTVELQGALGRLELTHNFAGATIRFSHPDDAEFTTVHVPADFPTPTGDAEFIEAIRAGGDVAPDFEDGWRVQQIVDAALVSAAEGRWVDLPVGEHDTDTGDHR